MKTIRWGIIGCGDVTEVKSGPALQKAANSALVAVMRRNGHLARDYAQRHGVPRWYDNAQRLIADPEIDAIYIATPPDAHREYTLAAAQAGKPVYVEKPMARNFAECQQMIAACQQAGVPLWVAYYRRCMPKFVKVKELIAAGAIGQPRYVQISLHRKPRGFDAHSLPWRVRPEIAGGGFFIDLASHILDYLDDLFGPIQRVSGYATNQAGLYAAEDLVTGTFVFASGVQGTGAWCFCAPDRLDQIEIIGEQGKLAFAAFENADPITVTTATGDMHYQIDPPAHVQQPLIQTIVDELNGVGHCPSTGLSAARTTWVMEEMIKEYYQPRLNLHNSGQ
jgi:predicted dehydrogenase